MFKIRYFQALASILLKNPKLLCCALVIEPQWLAEVYCAFETGFVDSEYEK